MLVRASIGTLASLGLAEVKVAVPLLTAYLLQYSVMGCEAACAFCSQSSLNSCSKELLSRITWPPIEIERLLHALVVRKPFQRVCLQTVLKEGFYEELLEVVREVTSSVRLPLSVATTPISRGKLRELKELGVERIGIGLDACSPEVFKRVHKPYTWDRYLSFITDALKVFGRGRVCVHLIVGLGESLEDYVHLLARLKDMGAEVALFAFTPVPGTPMATHPPPPLEIYRVFQAVRQLIYEGYAPEEILSGRGLWEIQRTEAAWKAFLTSGCPSCNRPFYNGRVTSPYNYPSKELLARDLVKVLNELKKGTLELERGSKEC